MISDDRLGHLRDIHVGEPSLRYPLTDSDWIAYARAIEREAIAEPVKLMRALVEADDSESVDLLIAATKAIRDYLERMNART